MGRALDFPWDCRSPTTNASNTTSVRLRQSLPCALCEPSRQGKHPVSTETEWAWASPNPSCTMPPGPPASEKTKISERPAVFDAPCDQKCGTTSPYPYCLLQLCGSHAATARRPGGPPFLGPARTARVAYPGSNRERSRGQGRRFRFAGDLCVVWSEGKQRASRWLLFGPSTERQEFEPRGFAKQRENPGPVRKAGGGVGRASSRTGTS